MDGRPDGRPDLAPSAARPPGAHPGPTFWLVTGAIVLFWFLRHAGPVMEWLARPALLVLPIAAVLRGREGLGSIGLNRRNIALALPP